MGAVFNSYRPNAVTQGELKEWYAEACKVAAHESGHSYSGEINMTRGLTIEDREFASIAEADDYLASRCEKWKNAVAVRVRGEERGTFRWYVGAWCAS